MGQIIGSAAKPKRCNLQSLSSLGTPAAGEHILVSSDNSMNAAGQGNFDCYIVGDGKTSAMALPLHRIADLADSIEEGVEYGDSTSASASAVQALIFGETSALSHGLNEGYHIRYGSPTSLPIKQNNSWGYTDRIPARYGDVIKSIFGVNATTGQGGVVCIAFYDADDNPLNAWTVAGYDNMRDNMVINDANAAYIRGNIYLENKEECAIFINGEQVWEYANETTEGQNTRVVRLEDTCSELDKTINGVPIEHNIPIKGGYLAVRTNTNIPIILDEDWGITDFIPVEENDVVKSIWGMTEVASSDLIAIGIYDSEKNSINFYSAEGYSNERDNMVISFTGAAYICANIYLPNKENCAVYVNGVEVWGYGTSNQGLSQRVEAAEEDIVAIQEDVEDIKKKQAEERLYLPIVSLINADTSSGYITHSSLDPKRVTTESAMCIPLEERTWHVILPTGYSLYLWLGNSAGAGWATNAGGWLVNGSTFDAGAKKSYRVVFRKGTGTTNVPASEIQALVDSGEAAIYTEFSQEDVVARNKTKTNEVDALKRVLLTTLADNGMNSMPIFAHISDLHGDVQRLENCLQYCDHLGVDALFASGDTTLYRSNQDFTSFQPEIAAKHNTDFLFCIGNHEAYPTGQTNIFTNHMSALASRYNYLKSSGTPTDVCYWYKDYVSRSIRVITIDYYNDGVYNGSIGQAQIDWFISTLLSTPTGYGVIVMLHSPEDKVVATSPYDVFRQKHRVTTYQETGFYVGNRPIMNIVDAFISKASISESYTENSTTVNVVADFSSMDASTEFIAYVCGHRHEDWVGYYDHSVNKQLCLDITTGNAMYGDSANPAWANQSDLPRGGESVCQDAFNLYAIDRAGGCVKIVRIGADITETFDERRMMVIPYKD